MHDHDHRRRRARRAVPDRRRRRRLRRDQPGRLLGDLRGAAHRRRRSTGAGLHLHQRPRQRDHLRGGAGAGPPRGRAHRRGALRRPGGVLALAHRRRRSCAGSGPEKGVIHMADRRAGQRGLGPAGQAGRQAAVAAARRDADRGAGAPASTSTTSPTRSPRTRRRRSWTRAASGYAERLAELERDGFPSYTTSVGWLGYPDDKVRALTRAGVRRGLAGDEDEGRRRRSTTTCAGPGIIRDGDRPGRAADDGRQPGLGRRRGDRQHGAGWPSSTRTGSRSPPTPTTCSATPASPRGRADRRPVPGRHRRGRREPGHLQAAAAGRGDRRLPGRRLPGRRRQRGARRAADGGQVRRAGLPARRRRRPVRVRPAPGDLRLPAGRHARWTAGWSSTSTTCTSTSSTRCAPRGGRYLLPTSPGYSVDDEAGVDRRVLASRTARHGGDRRPAARPATLDRLPAGAPPAGATRAAGAGIVHLGLGAFHRAHQAVYTEEAIAARGGDWGIVGVAPRSRDVLDALAAQDRLFSV